MPRAANAVVTFDRFWDSDAKPTATPDHPEISYFNSNSS